MFSFIACNFILGHMLVSTCRCNCVPRHYIWEYWCQRGWILNYLATTWLNLELNSHRRLKTVNSNFAVNVTHKWENASFIGLEWSSREWFRSIIQSYVHYYRLLWDLVCIGCFYLCILDYYFIVTWNDYTKYNVTLWDEILGLESSSRIRSCVNRTAIIILSSQFK